MNNIFAFMRRSYDAGYLTVIDKGAPTFQKRKRFTLAEVNAGASFLVAPGPTYAFRMITCRVIAIGGNAATGTSVDILGTRAASSVKLVAYATAGLTRSALVRDGNSNTTLLADGTSHTVLDANTAITVNKTGADFATATHFDVIMDYAVEKV